MSTERSIASHPIVFWNADGEYSLLSTEEVVARGLNRFVGWNCTAGLTSIFIDFDGNVFRGVCAEGGTFGNIFAQARFPGTSITCAKPNCMCGGDLMAHKFRPPLTEAGVPLRRMAKNEIAGPQGVGGSEWLYESGRRKRVAWSLGRRCNYDCHYCSDSVHSLKEPLKESERLLKATRRVIEEFCQGVPTEFLIAGGEPTLQPGLVEMVRMIHEAGHGSVVITNGSGREGVYRELARYSHICMSGHFGFMREERFLKNARTAIASVRTLPRKTRKVRRIDIKIMTPPGTFDRSIAFARRVLEIPNYQSYGTMRFNPLFMRDQPDRLYEYSRNELDKFTEYNDNWNQVLAFGRPGLIVRAYFWRGLRRVVKPVVAFTKSACLGLMKAFWLAPPVRWTRARLLKGYHFTEYVVLNRETTVPKAMALIGLRRR